MRVCSCIALLLGLTCVAPVAADPPSSAPRPLFKHWFGTSACPSVGCCPDDYARKPMPPIVGIGDCGGVNDYCRKPFPCVPALPRCGGPDDYCRKLLPCLLCPPLTPYLQCAPPPECCPACGLRR